MSHTTLVDTLADAANDAMSSARTAVIDTASLMQGKAARLTKRTTRYVKNNDAREKGELDEEGIIQFELFQDFIHNIWSAQALAISACSLISAPRSSRRILPS